MTDEAAYIRSRKELEAAELLLDNGYYGACVSRCYYSMFYLVQELFKEKDLHYSTHAGLISQFGHHFIKEGTLDREYSKILRRGFERRMLGDYGQTASVSKEVAIRALTEAKRFHHAIMDVMKEKWF